MMTRFASAVLLSLIALPAAATSPPPPPFIDREVRVPVAAVDGAGAATLACSLRAPSAASGARVAAVALLPGTGPGDRDENGIGATLKYSVLRRVADRLAAHGIASLRCDDRGTGASTGRFEERTFPVFIADGTAMIAALRREPTIDGARIALYGHSEGGIAGVVIADRDAGLRALVLAAAAERPFLDGVLAQKRDELRDAGQSPAEVDATIAFYRTVLLALAAGKPIPDGLPPPARAEVERLAPWLRSRLAHDNRASSRRLRHLPILIQQGGRDVVVPPDDAELLRADLAAGHNPDAKLLRYPTLQHNFAPAREGERLPRAEVAAQPLDDAAAFLATQLR